MKWLLFALFLKAKNVTCLPVNLADSSGKPGQLLGIDPVRNNGAGVNQHVDVRVEPEGRVRDGVYFRRRVFFDLRQINVI